MRVMLGACVCAPICLKLNTRKLNTWHIIQSMAMCFNGGTHAYDEHKSIAIMYCRISLNRSTFVKFVYMICVILSLPQFTWLFSVSEVGEENAIPCVNNPYYLAINWVIWSLKFMWSCICLSGDCEHAVKIPTGPVQCAALKGDGRWTLIGLLQVTPRTHLPGSDLQTLFGFTSGAKLIYPPL